MKRSKILFGIIAAVVAIAVVVILLISGTFSDAPTEPMGTTSPTVDNGSNPTTPAPNDGTQPTDSAESTVPATEPSGTTGSMPDLGWLDDFLGIDLTDYSYITGEVPASEMPESYGKYANIYDSSCQVSNPGNSKEDYIFSFGPSDETKESMNGVTDYLCLNPVIRASDHTLAYNDSAKNGSFYFCFIPSEGYVTTFTDKAPGEAKRDDWGCFSFTFNRAMDYCVPSNYVDDTNIGTVWYLDKPTASEHVTIDILAYRNKEFFASLRLYIDLTEDGAWCLSGTVNRDHFVQEYDGLGSYYGYEMNWASQEQIDALVAEAKKCLGSWASELTNDDFIIERRAVGQGTYYPYAGTYSGGEWDLFDTAELKNEELWAVSYRRAQGKETDMTYYFRIIEGGGENGADAYEVIALDHVYHYEIERLWVDRYPGYSDRK